MSLSCCQQKGKLRLRASRVFGAQGHLSPGLILWKWGAWSKWVPGHFNCHWRKTSTSQGRLIPPPGVSFCCVLSTAGRVHPTSHRSFWVPGVGGQALSLCGNTAQPAARFLCPGDTAVPTAAFPPSGAPWEHPQSPAEQLPPSPISVMIRPLMPRTHASLTLLLIASSLLAAPVPRIPNGPWLISDALFQLSCCNCFLCASFN